MPKASDDLAGCRGSVWFRGSTFKAALPARASLPRRVRAFTLIELLVVVSIIALLISILLPSLGKAKELANRVYCAANLSGIGKSLAEYGQSEGDLYPCVVGPANGTTYNVGLATAASGSSTTADLAASTYFASSPAEQGSPLACLWLLVLRNYTANPKIYLCKSDPSITQPASVADSAGHYFNNFQSTGQISFAIAYPWSSSGTIGVWWRNNVDSAIPILCDMPPLSANGKNTAAPPGSGGKIYNSGNHADAGQNVAFGDAHVEWTQSPYMGVNENIFTLGPNGGAGISSIGVLPGQITTGTRPFDTIMVPVRNLSTGAL